MFGSDGNGSGARTVLGPDGGVSTVIGSGGRMLNVMGPDGNLQTLTKVGSFYVGQGGTYAVVGSGASRTVVGPDGTNVLFNNGNMGRII